MKQRPRKVLISKHYFNVCWYYIHLVLLPILPINQIFCRLLKDLLAVVWSQWCQMSNWSDTYNRLHTLAMCSVEISEASDGFVLDSVKWARRADLLWRFSRIRMQRIEASLRRGVCYFCESSSWHELKQKTLTDRRPGGKVAVEARHSGRGLRALCCLKTTGATVGQVSWEASVPVWCTLMARKHTHTRTDAPGSWGRNREYGRWRASQLELEHSAFALLLPSITLGVIAHSLFFQPLAVPFISDLP